MAKKNFQRVHGDLASLQKLLQQVATKNDSPSWLKLFAFAPTALRLPAKTKSERTSTLATAVKKNLDLFDRDIEIPPLQSAKTKRKRSTDEDIARRVGEKIDDGSVSGAMRIVMSTDSVADITSDTLKELRAKHPEFAPPPVSVLNADTHVAPPVTAADVFAAIRSFPRGSAAGPDGLRPQHLIDIVGGKMDDHSGQFCESLAAVLNVVLEGKVPADIRPAFFGGKLLALRKKDGGLRPIAVGMTLRRVIAKIVCSKVAERAVAVLSPGQVGFNVRGGAEAIVHGTRQFINENPEITKAIVKVDFRNAFNTVSREVVLDAVKSHFPEYFAFFQSAYGHHSSLFIGEHVMSSESGVQQGDPLGPLLFCLALQAVILTLNTELNAWYLDDGTLGGLPESVQENLARVIEGARRIGLEINVTKCKLYVSGGSETAQQKAVDDFLVQHPGVRVMSSSSLTLLGAPVLDAAIAPLFAEKAQSLATVCERMQLLPRHHALFLLRHCLGAPKIVYMLRCSNAWKYSEQLYKIDESCVPASNSCATSEPITMTIPAGVRRASRLAEVVLAYVARRN
ncbi:uncharacterized protein LOC129595098 [Paramacrobiotus metropolitanus]|uniref:uncharacterized protein LOC129595098 n=1 Tax=Paramacrobiotus metropolitanus TaxID=2943436 RepID=UPI002445C25D|nr:uncharacterized protein LOC129595098 [Paramacrobiotus metropolitanus]